METFTFRCHTTDVDILDDFVFVMSIDSPYISYQTSGISLIWQCFLNKKESTPTH